MKRSGVARDGSTRGGLLCFAALALLGCGITAAAADEPPPTIDTRARAALRRGASWLRAQQGADGRWRSQRYGLLRGGETLTAFAVGTLVRVAPHLLPKEAAEVEAALVRADGFLLHALAADGALGTGDPVDEYPVYATALWLASGRPSPETAARLVGYLRGAQARRPAPVAGGFGLRAPFEGNARGLRIEVSHTAIALGALEGHAPRGDALWTRARGFLRRCQNLSPAGTKKKNAVLDGGFSFTPQRWFAKTLPLGEAAPGRFGAYGSATADGLLALLSAGADPAGAEVQAAAGWLARHLSLRDVPGLEAPAPGRAQGQGLRFYWAWRLAEAARRVTARVPRSPLAVSPWRQGVVAAVVRAQRVDGAWQNASGAMLEDEALIATGEALQALAAVLDVPRVPEKKPQRSR